MTSMSMNFGPGEFEVVCDIQLVDQQVDIQSLGESLGYRSRWERGFSINETKRVDEIYLGKR